ncbi:DUF7344 domain-containing protein [Haladaptatus sp. NG-WS-4]
MNPDSSETPDSKASTRGSDELDSLMELLADRRRRQTLYFLRESGETVTVGELVRRIAEMSDASGETDHARLETEFRHKHLPKMEAVGIIGRDGDEIRLRESVSSIAPYLDLAARMERTS